MIVTQLIVKHMCLCVNISMSINTVGGSGGGVVKLEDEWEKESLCSLRKEKRHLAIFECPTCATYVALIDLHVNPV